MTIPRNFADLAPGVDASGVLQPSNGGTGATTLTTNNVILGNGTSAVQFVAPGTNGNILTSNGTAWVSQAASSSGAQGFVTQYNGIDAAPAGLVPNNSFALI